MSNKLARIGDSGPFSRIFGDFESIFGSPIFQISDWEPGLAELDNQYVIKVELPGFSENDIQVDIKGGLLKISGEVKIEEDGFSSDKSFSKSWSLPDNIVQDKVEATIKNGILTVKIPKSENVELPERSVQVKQLDK